MMIGMKNFYLVLFLLLSGCANFFLPANLAELHAATKEKLLSMLGKPTIARDEGAHQIYTYYQNGCSVLIFLDNNETVRHIDQRGECLF
jgi:hypothetical protein